MLKLYKIISFGLLSLALSSAAWAQVEFNTSTNREVKQLRATGFLNYPPFGVFKNPSVPASYFNIFQPVIANYAKYANFMVDYTTNYSYPELVRMVRGGKIDILAGVYHDTEMYQGLEIVYPALLNNPIMLVMLPDQISSVKNTDDLKKLKGAISTKEYLSDFVSNEMKNFNLQRIDDDYTLYQKLFRREIDYIFTSNYYAKVVQAQLGIRNKVSFSKEAIWNMPLFIAISKMSPYRKQVYNGLTVYLAQPKAQELVEQEVAKYIAEVEKQNAGRVAPDFINN